MSLSESLIGLRGLSVALKGRSDVLKGPSVDDDLNRPSVGLNGLFADLVK